MRKKVRTGIFLSLVLVAAAAVLLVGCKKKDAEKEPIKIGAILSITGPVSFLGDPEGNTAEMLVEKINADGGVKGHPIELIIRPIRKKPSPSPNSLSRRRTSWPLSGRAAAETPWRSRISARRMRP